MSSRFSQKRSDNCSSSGRRTSLYVLFVAFLPDHLIFVLLTTNQILHHCSFVVKCCCWQGHGISPLLLWKVCCWLYLFMSIIKGVFVLWKPSYWFNLTSVQGKFRAYHAPDICHSHFVTSVSHRPYSGSVSRTDSLTKPIRRGRQSRVCFMCIRSGAL